MIKRAKQFTSKAQRRASFYVTHKLLAGPKPKPVNVVPYRVTVCEDATARGAGYLHRVKARALPMRSWVREF
jgi:hypothetical protein